MNYFDYFQTLLIIFLLLGLMYGALYFIKKNFYGAVFKNNGNARVKTLAIVPLMPKKYIAIVEINDKILTIGISDQNMVLLDKEEKENDGNENPNASDDKVSKDENNFIDILKKNLGFK